MADGTKNAREKHMWRDMSESWLAMIGYAEREDFAGEEREHGTKQPKSELSHQSLHCQTHRLIGEKGLHRYVLWTGNSGGR